MYVSNTKVTNYLSQYKHASAEMAFSAHSNVFFFGFGSFLVYHSLGCWPLSMSYS